MSSIDYNVRKQKGRRAIRKKAEEIKGLSITSLLDVLTILLVFLIKNVSMEAVKISELPDMKYPTTATVESLMDNAIVTPVKLYRDRVLLGLDNQLLGTPEELIEDVETRSVMLEFFQSEMREIPEDRYDEACLIVQADRDIPCAYITEIVRVGTNTGYQNIYFATLEEADWLSSYASASFK
nr:hypothetical protein [Candidatus Cloacimonadota bacterium]